MKKIPYGRQTISERDISAVEKVLRSDFLTQGPVIKQFETAIANYCGVPYAIAFSSGGAALHGACFAAGIGPGDEVITTPMTFAASANCVLYCGGTPVFADIYSDLPLIDPAEIKEKITKKTRAIIPVDYSGIPADYDEINLIAKKNNLIVIADAAHSLGSIYKGKKVGTLADMTMFSFHPVKLITTGEGGMVVTNNKKYYEKLLMFRTHGITKDPEKLINKNEGPWYYEMQELGFNYRLTDMQAALGLSQFKKINVFLKRRTLIAQQYIEAFKKMTNMSCTFIPKDRTSAWHLFPVLLQSKNLRKTIVFTQFKKAGIQLQVHYIPVHFQPYYQKFLKAQKGHYPYSEDYYRREITLPLYPSLTSHQIENVIEATQKILG